VINVHLLRGFADLLQFLDVGDRIELLDRRWIDVRQSEIRKPRARQIGVVAHVRKKLRTDGAPTQFSFHVPDFAVEASSVQAISECPAQEVLSFDAANMNADGRELAL
jgi:hypothetical protein